MKRQIIACSSYCALLLLAACDGGTVQETLGISRDGPDEFRVVSRPPLSVPPQFNLRPPARPGEAVSGQAMDKQAQSLVLGTTPQSGASNTFVLQPGNADTAVAPVETQPAVETAGKTMPEHNLLQRAGAQEANPNIRETLEQDKIESHQVVEEEDGWWDVLSTMPAKKDPLVDAKKEAERLKQNEEEGKPVTEGKTPEVKARDTGILGRILGY